MIINTQFFITYYVGKEILKLTETPDNLSDSQLIEYNKLMQSISAIYASQNLDSGGTIPKFWTQLVQYTDSLGNTAYRYAPHPDSDLTQLDPRSSYYFIVRDESALPLRIPAAGGALLGFTDTSLLPLVDNETIKDISLTTETGNSTVLDIGLKQLQAYEEYLYVIKSVDVNWPINVYGISGVIKPGSDTASINSRLVFCPSTGVCGNNILNYSLNPSCLFNSSNLYGILQLSIRPLSYDGPEILSNQFVISCEDCLPSPTISINSTDDKIVSFDSTNNLLGFYDFTLSFDDLQPNSTYSYFVETFNSEWPTFFVGNTSGTITTSANGAYPGAPIASKLVFCKSTGLCPTNQDGINSYSVPDYSLLWRSGLAYNVGMRACLSFDGCGGYIRYGEPVTLSYNIEKSNVPYVSLNVVKPVVPDTPTDPTDPTDPPADPTDPPTDPLDPPIDSPTEI
jgi:hypothetical protein